jgi:hypothetical protein
MCDILQLWFILPPPHQVNTLHLHANQQHLASSASDGAVAIWDVRNLTTAAAGGSSGRKQQQGKAAKPLCALGHNKSSQGAYWCPDGRWDMLLLLQLCLKCSLAGMLHKSGGIGACADYRPYVSPVAASWCCCWC